MPITDAQVHVYEANSPRRRWHGEPNWLVHVTGDEMVAAMDAVGVDGAILVSPFTLYRYDASYAIAVRDAHPGRFAIVKPVDPDDPAVEDVVAAWKETPGAVAVRLLMDSHARPTTGEAGRDRVARAAARHGLPVNVHCWENLAGATALIDRHPDTRFVIDHLGLVQPFVPARRTLARDPWADLPTLLALARRPNAVVKVTGACTLSAEPYPFRDIREPLARVFDAWGLERCLWGTDWSRAIAVVSYEPAVSAFRAMEGLGADERTMLMGGASARVYGWSPTTAE